MKKADLILTTDWHLRDTKPKCRTDDFWIAQMGKVRFVSELQRKHKCPVFHAGDLFHHWKPSPYLLTFAIERMPDRLVSIYGNHDLPFHNFENRDKCGLYTVESAGRGSIPPIGAAHWGIDPHSVSTLTIEGRKVLMWHVMTYDGETPWPGCKDVSAGEILDMFSEIDLIVTGHNHKSFVVEKDGRLLVNPGSLTRQEAGDEGREPCVWLWYARENKVRKVVLPHETEVFSRQHIERAKKRDSRIMAYVERLKNPHRKFASFDKNLEAFERENDLEPEVAELIRKSMEA